jgi:Na+/melibiose symporter-like transporter
MVLSMFGASMSISLNEICIFAVGFGLGNLFPVAMVSVQNAADPRDLGVSTATYGFLRSLGSAIGIAILGAIGAASGVGVHKSASGDEGEAAKHLLATGFSHVFAAAALTQLLVFLLLIRMEQRPLRETQSAITETEGA